MHKVVTLYDTEKNYMTGNGKHSISLNANKYKDKDELEAHVKKLKEEQKEKNRKFNEEYKDIMSKSNTKVTSDIVHEKDVTLKLDPNTGNSTLILGSSKRGKSTLLMYIYNKYYCNKDYVAILFSINAHIDLYKDKKLIRCNVFNKAAEKLIYREKFINSKTDNKYNFVNLVDDIIDVRYSKVINDMILTLRNSKISTILSTQYTNLVSKAARSSVNNVFIFGFNTNESVIVVINVYLASHFSKLGFTTIESQVQFFNDVTKDHGFIYLKPETGQISFHRLKI